MVVDASAIIAIMFEEAEAPDCMAALQTEALRLISAVNYVEAGTVMAGRIKDGDWHEAIADLDAFLSDFGIAIAPIDDNLARAAMRARLDYCKGIGMRGGPSAIASPMPWPNGIPLLFSTLATISR